MLEDHYPKALLTKVEEEVLCMNHCFEEAKRLASKGQTDKAECYLNNAFRSLKQLGAYSRSFTYTPQPKSYYDEMIAKERKRQIETRSSV
ncbi:hypothetical protein [Gracilibacillus sp. YIM 98692]|uniref:hypothetical protein n=1 Tax=Gracilibacillus sp. YIM 98692 TaxID=2663532 RepID=UPI0013D8624E|nr:hypothetical protein [Gracilibacillus sp. YIM 98692]